MADRGRFMSDEECNPSNRDGCARYHEGAVHCFKMVNPRSAFNFYMYNLHKSGVKKKKKKICKLAFPALAL